MPLDNQTIRMNLISALAKSPLLKLLGKNNPHCQEFRAMLEASEIREYHTGQVIIREGQQSDRMYFLASGRVKVLHEGKVLAVLSQIGDVFGEIGPLTGALRSATVVAAEEVTCLATSANFARQLAQAENVVFAHVLQQALTKMLASRLNHVCEELLETQAELLESQSREKLLRRANEQLKDELDRAGRSGQSTILEDIGRV